MNRSTKTKAAGLVFSLTLLLSGAPLALGYFSPPPAPAQQSAGIAFADPAFQTTWERTDQPVATGKATRSWMWGPQGFWSGYEPWAESPGGKHLVQYFDKSRMEVNDPNADRNSQWFVTNGLLVVEMMTGHIMTGVNAFNQSAAAAIPVAGDANTSVNAPTYATAAKVASLQGNNRAPDRTGQPANQILDRYGNVSTASKTQNQVVNVVYEATLGHNIPNVFWQFMNQSGVVYKNGTYVTEKVFDWVFAMGYPLTEPYWISINVSGKDQWVLMQAYQRRILTFNPNNDPAFQVEMGNVGRSYYDWRYNQQGAVLPTATPKPATPPPAALTINPTSGPANSTITVSGTGFTPYNAISINVTSKEAGYDQPVATVGADAAGSFSTFITLPGEVAKQGSVVITAAGANGVPTLSQTFTITHNPSFNASPLEVTNRGVLELTGSDFTANTQLTITAYQVGNNNPVLSGPVTTDGNGAFKKTYTLAGKASVGAQYTMVATGPNNLKAQIPNPIKVVPQPSVVVNPPKGNAGVNVTFSGQGWVSNRVLQVSLQGENGQTQQIVNPVVTDGSGNFATNVFIPSEYAGQSKVLVWALDSSNGISVNAPYTVNNPVPPAGNPYINVVPNPIVSNQSIQVTGAKFPGGQIVTVAIGAAGGALAPVASTSANNNGDWSVHFNLPSGLANAGMVTVSATSTNGTNAHMDVPVTNASPPPANPYIYVAPNPIVPGQDIQVSGAKFPGNQGVTVSIGPVGGALTQVANTVANNTGDWSVHFNLPQSLYSTSKVTVSATSATGANVRMDVPVQAAPKPYMSVQPNPIVSNLDITVTGAAFPGGQLVTVSVGLVGGAMAPVATTTANNNGDWSAHFFLPAGLVSAGTVTVSATSTNGANAHMDVPVTNAGPAPGK